MEPDSLNHLNDILKVIYLLFQSLQKLAFAIYREFFQKQKLKIKLEIFWYFLIFAENLDCGYTLEPRR